VTSPDAATREPAAEPPQRRLAWLDVLRGLAALAVVFNHSGYFLPAGVKAAVYQWINPGDYGAFVFFIISGYIVPASLERKGSVRTFWVSRVFLLYPLHLLSVGIGLACTCCRSGRCTARAGTPRRPSCPSC
jgi:peptidoglycan/LPS O-acetylase OafA/YrhL